MIQRFKKLAAAVVVAGVALSAVGCQGVSSGGGGEGDLANWKGANYMPEKNSFSKSLIEVSNYLQDQGVAKSELFHQGSLLGPEDILPGVSEGRANFGIINPFYYPGDLPLTNVASVPFISNDPWAFTTALNDLYVSNAALKAEYAKAGVELITFVPVSATIVGTKKEVKTLGDLKGKKIRAVGLLSSAFSEIGASPVSVPAGDIYQSIEQGVIDGYTSYPFDIAVDNSFNEVAPKVIDAGTGTYSVGAILMNKSNWDSLSEDQQKKIRGNMATFTDDSSDQIAKDLKEMCDKFLKADGSATALSEGDVSKFKDIVGDSLIKQWKKDAEGSGVDADTSTKFLAELEDAIHKHEQESTYDLTIGPCIAQAGKK